MPRSLVTDPERIRGELLFGSKANQVNLSILARMTGIPLSTLSDYKSHPDSIPLGRLSEIIKARSLDDDKIIQLIKKGKNHEGNKARKH